MSGKVVKEFPVILTKSCKDELYVFEYPLKNKESSEFLHNVYNTRIKPVSQVVEVDVSLDQSGPHYNKLRARDIAEGMSESNNGSGDDGPMLEKITYRSDPIADPKLIRSRMGLLYRRGGKLYLAPLAGMANIIPTMDHMERKSSLQETESKEEQLRAVNVKFGRAETEASKARRDNRYSAWRRRIDAEPWVQCLYSPFDEETAVAQRAALHTVADESRLEDKNVKFADQRTYLNLVAPKSDPGQSKAVNVLPSNTVSLSQLKSLPLEQQVKVLMINAKVMRFARLVETLRFAGSSESDVHLTNVLQAVQGIAVLVHACWVVKSDILYPTNTFSAHSGVPRDVLVRGRDFILWKFTQNCAITRKEISSTIKLPTEEVTEIMQQIARQRRPSRQDPQRRGRRRKWEFIFDDDKEFSRRYPEIVEAQEKMWEARFQQLCSALKLDRARISREKEVTSRRKERRLSRRYSSSSDTEYASPDAHRRRRRTRSASTGSSPGAGAGEAGRSGFRSFNRSRSSSECPSPAKAAGLSGAPSLMDVDLPEVTAEPEARSSSVGPSVEFPSAEFEANIRQFVANKLKSRLVVPLCEMSQPFRLHLPRFGSVGSAIDNESLDAMLVEAALKEGGRELSIASSSGAKPKVRLLMNKTFHEGNLQQTRDCLLQMFSEAPGITLAQFRQRAADIAYPPPDDSALRKLLKMYCSFKGKYYFLKWTLDSE